MRCKGMARLMSAVLVLAVLFTAASPAFALTSDEIQQEIDALKQQQSELGAQMEELEEKLSQNFQQMEDMVAQKDTIDRQIVLLHQQIENVNAQIRACGQLVADRQDALDAAQQRLEVLNERHKERIRAMEEEGKLSYWSVLFKSSSFSDFLDRLNMIREIAQADQRRLQELQTAAEAVQSAKTLLEEEKDSLEQTRQQLAQTQVILDGKRAQADGVLRELMAREEEFQALLLESEKKQDDLMQQLAQKETEFDEALYREWLESYVPPVTQQPGPEIPESSADWITPVPYYTLTSPFGMRMHPILGYERMHNGVDMACAAGTPIYASRGGQVEITGYQPDGAGNYVQINHGDGFRSIYMHMTNYIVSTGDYVAPGQVIGYVGNTGLSKGNHLHFGISYNGTYVNPMEYI